MKTETRAELGWTSTMRPVVAVGCVAVLITLPIYGWRFASSVAVGAAIAAGNLWLISRGVSAIVSGAPTARHSLLFLLKFSVVITGLYLLFDSRLVQGLPLLVGLAVLPIGILISQISSAGSLREG